MVTGNSLYGRSKIRNRNLNNLTKAKTLKIYLGEFKSDSDKITADKFKQAFKQDLLDKITYNFDIVDTKEEAKLVIDADLVSYRYLEDDPPDQIVGGVTGFVVDCIVKQNYAEIIAYYEVRRTKDNKRLWYRKFKSTVTRGNMPEDDAIPRVLNACADRFIALCFGSPRHDNL